MKIGSCFPVPYLSSPLSCSDSMAGLPSKGPSLHLRVEVLACQLVEGGGEGGGGGGHDGAAQSYQ